MEGGAFATVIIDELPQVLADPELPGASAIEEWYNNEILLMASIVDGTAMGNGLSNHVINMKQNEWYRMRIISVDPGGQASTLQFPLFCDVHAAAHDGVWRFEVPKATSSRSYTLTGSSRLDVAIRCSRSGALRYGWTSTVATIRVSGSSTSTASPFDADGNPWASFRPWYLRDLRSLPSESFETFVIEASEDAINGIQYDPEVPLGEWSYDSLQQWTIQVSGGS